MNMAKRDTAIVRRGKLRVKRGYRGRDDEQTTHGR
jgi:hypothetical protein